MPITNWWCGAHKAVVPLDHFNHCTHVHPDYASVILADRAKNAERTGVRVSSASACARKYAILASEDVAVDPLSFLTAMRGTAWHSVMEKGAALTGSDDALSTDVVGAELSVAGTIGGIELTGTIDRVLVRDGKLIGQDHKTGKDARAVFIRGGRSYGKQVAGAGSPMEYKVQLSLYAELYHQQTGQAWDTAEIWWTFSAEHWCEPIKILTPEQCLAWRPYDSEFTIAELLAQAQQVVDGTASWSDLPLAGKTFRFGPKFTGCDYCEVRDKCWTQASGAPF